jgi:tetratricopeptide (TPR) repeat protein
VTPPRAALRALVSLALVAGVLVVYAPVREFGFINFDDPQYVTTNPVVRDGLSWSSVGWALTGPHAKLWHPLTSLSHLLDTTLFGVVPGPPHLGNVALHAASAWACFAVLLAMTGRFGPSAAAAMLFAWHPARVESVAWIAERKDVLSMLLAWATLGAWTAHVRRPSRGRLALAVFCCAASILSKAMMVSLPLVLLLLDGWPLGRLALGWKRLLAEKAPFFVLAGVSATITYVVQSAGGAVAGDDLGLATRAANATVATVRYLGLLAWPVDLAIFYPYRSWPASTVALAAATLAGLTAAAFVVRHRLPYVTMGWLWYLVTLFPVSGIVQAGSQSMADRFTYLPSVGLAIALAWTLADAARALRLPAALPLALAAGTGVAMLVATRRQVETWRDSETVFRHAITVTGDNYLAENQLGEALAARGRLDEAAPHYERSLRLNPRFPEAHVNVANAFARRGETAAAEARYREALALDPRLPEAHNGLGVLLAQRGDHAGAAREYRAALAHRALYAEAQSNLGNALRHQGDFAGAAQAYEAALALQPGWLDARVGLARAQVGMGRAAEAEGTLRAVLAQDPGQVEAEFYLVLLLLDRGAVVEARERIGDVLRRRPDFEPARALLHELDGRSPDAVQD